MDIYILFGMTGAYSDKKIWISSIYSDESEAVNARDELRELLNRYNGNDSYILKPGLSSEYLPNPNAWETFFIKNC